MRSHPLSGLAGATFLLIGGALLPACHDRSADAAPAEAGATAAAASNQPAGKVIKLAKLGIEGFAAGITADPSFTDVAGSTIVTCGGLSVGVAAATDGDPKTIAAAQDESKAFNPKNFKSEALADGWIVTYDNVGGGGPNFFVAARREIGGHAYSCETMLASAEQRDKAVAFCKTLKSSGAPAAQAGAAPQPPARTPLARCYIKFANGNVDCTEFYGKVDPGEEASCKELGGAFDRGSSTCPHDGVTGRCESVGRAGDGPATIGYATGHEVKEGCLMRGFNWLPLDGKTPAR